MTPTAAAPASAPKALRPVLVLALGACLGFALSRIGFTSYAELHRMFVFADLRMFLVFMGGVALTGAGLVVTRRWSALGRTPVQRGTVAGGVLFGVGWAVAGACPGVVFAQLGEGKLWSGLTLAGVVVGTLLARVVARGRAGPTPEDAPSCG